MACRGRGTLSIRPSRNPFFQPSSRDDRVEFEAPTLEREKPRAKIEDDYDFSFLYARSTQDIGKGIPTHGSRLGKAMAKTISLGDMSRLKAGTKTLVERKDDDEVDPTALAEAIVAVYDHQPKGEHIMYQTSANEYGSQAPTVATLTAERKARSQQFSNSFNAVKYRDQGLNTSVTKSNVHDALDFF